MKTKKILLFAIAILIVASIAISCIACINNEPKDSEKTAKTMAKELLSAQSYTVEQDGTVMLKYNGNSLYFKDIYEDEYDEYYFMPDSEGKYWIYSKSYDEDSWTKESYGFMEYIGYMYELKYVFVGYRGTSFIACLDLLFMDWDNFMNEDDGNYTLKTTRKLKALGLNTLKLSKIQDILLANLNVGYDGETENITLKIYDINSTVVTLSESASKADIGEVYLP